MKIAYISESIIPSRTANSIHVMKMCQAFAKNGHDVILFAPLRSNKTLASIDYIFESYGVEKCFTIKWVDYPSFRVIGLLYYSFSCALKARKEKSDIIYGRSIAGCFFSALLGLPVSWEAHQPPNNLLKNLLLRLLFLKSNFNKLIVISKPLKTIFENNFSSVQGKVIVAPDAADPLNNKHGTKQVLKLSPGRLQAGYVGHLYSGRGIELIAEMAKACGEIDFHLVGGLDKDIVWWKEKLKGIRNLTIHGFVSHAFVGTYLKAFDVLLAPYQSNVSVYGGEHINTSEWMSPLKIFEYMSAGKPIMCSDIPVLREVLKDEETAKLLPPEDVKKWVEAIRNINSNYDRAIKMGINAKRDFLKNYTWEARAKRVLD